MLLHIPHSSDRIPAHLRAALLLSDDELRAELLALTDAHTDTLFTLGVRPATPVIFPVSRLVVDPERFIDDSREPMAGKGMGVVYVRTADGRPLRTAPTAAQREQLLAAYYHPHHRRLTELVGLELAHLGRCLIIDCHSFPSRPLPYEEDQSLDRPDICIGTDSFHTPYALTVHLVAALESSGFSVALNRPFAGALVPAGYYRADTRVRSIMIEINRRLYMDERTGERTARFTRIAQLLGRLLTDLQRRAE